MEPPTRLDISRRRAFLEADGEPRSSLGVGGRHAVEETYMGTHIELGYSTYALQDIDPFEALQVELRFQTLIPSARAVLSPVHRKRITSSDLYTMVRNLSSAVQLHVR